MMQSSQKKWLFIAVLVGSLILTSVPGLAQTPSVGIQINQIIDVQFPNLQAYLSVTDQQGMPVADLSDQDFSIIEDGQIVTSQVKVTQVSPSNQPISIILAMNTSESMQDTVEGFPLQDLVNAGKNFIGQMQPGEKLGIVSFSNRAQTVLNLTEDKAALADSLDHLSASNSAAIFDGIAAGLDPLKNNHERRALIVLTNSETYYPSVEIQYANAQAKAQEWPTPIFIIAMDETVNGAARFERLSAATGGAYYTVTDPTRIDDRLLEILNTLRRQYQIELQSQFPVDGKNHALKISVAHQGKVLEAQLAFRARPQQVDISVAGYLDNVEYGGKLVFKPQVIAPQPPVTKVELFVDGKPQASTSAEPFELVWDATSVSEGEHQLTFSATDSAGQTGNYPLKVKIRPLIRVAIVNPVSDTGINGTATIEAQVDSLYPVSNVAFSINDQVVQTLDAPPFQYVWDTTRVMASAYKLSVEVTDINKSVAKTERTIQVVLQNNNSFGFIAVMTVLASLLVMIPVSLRNRKKMMPTHSNIHASTPASPQPAQTLFPGRSIYTEPQAVLTEKDAYAPGKMWPLTGDEVRVGRKVDENDVVLQSSKTSRRHAVIRYRQNQWMIYSLSPKNPVLVNGTQVVQQVLSQGDELRFADQIFIFTASGD